MLFYLIFMFCFHFGFYLCKISIFLISYFRKVQFAYINYKTPSGYLKTLNRINKILIGINKTSIGEYKIPSCKFRTPSCNIKTSACGYRTLNSVNKTPFGMFRTSLGNTKACTGLVLFKNHLSVYLYIKN